MPHLNYLLSKQPTLYKITTGLMDMTAMITPAQSRMARAALQLSAQDLASLAGVSAMTITRFETGKSNGYADTLDRIERAFTSTGVKFYSNNDGVVGVQLPKWFDRIRIRNIEVDTGVNFDLDIGDYTLHYLVTTEALENMARTGNLDIAKLKSYFRRYKAQILRVAQLAYDQAWPSQRGKYVVLESKHFQM